MIMCNIRDYNLIINNMLKVLESKDEVLHRSIPTKRLSPPTYHENIWNQTETTNCSHLLQIPPTEFYYYLAYHSIYIPRLCRTFAPEDKRSVTQRTEAARIQCFALVSRDLQFEAKKKRYNFTIKALKTSTLHLSPIFSALVKTVVGPFKR